MCIVLRVIFFDGSVEKEELSDVLSERGNATYIGTPLVGVSGASSGVSSWNGRVISNIFRGVFGKKEEKKGGKKKRVKEKGAGKKKKF